jgi:hypothetical protein
MAAGDSWTFFLISMDQYNLLRDASHNDAMVQRMGLVFADEFTFSTVRGDGTPFGGIQGRFTPRSWLEAQRIDQWTLVRGTLLVPNYQHILSVEEPGRRVRLEGYHEHAFVRADIRLATGDARQLAFETVTFEKRDGVWRITAYVETVWSASEL